MDHVKLHSHNDQNNIEATFWCGVLYAVGSYVIDNAPNPIDYKNDLMAKLFCGYFFLYTIATITETSDVSKPASLT